MMADLVLFAERRKASAPSRSAPVFGRLPGLAGLVLPACLVFLASGCGGAKQEARRGGDLSSEARGSSGQSAGRWGRERPPS